VCCHAMLSVCVCHHPAMQCMLEGCWEVLVKGRQQAGAWVFTECIFPGLVTVWGTHLCLCQVAVSTCSANVYRPSWCMHACACCAIVHAHRCVSCF
jgi:hypothetical protein